MKIIIMQQELVTALNAIKLSIPRRATLPILRNVKIEATTDVVTFSATTLESYAEYSAAAWQHETGACTVDHKDLLALVRPLKGQSVTLSLGDAGLSVSTRTMSVTLPTIDAEEFPRSPRAATHPLHKTWKETLPSGEKITRKVTAQRTDCKRLPVATFRQMVGLVGYAASTDYSRPVLTSIYAHVEKDVLTLAAADIFRLATVAEPVYTRGTWEQPLLIVARPLIDAVKSLPKDGDVTITTIYTTITWHSEAGRLLDESTEVTFTSIDAGPLTVDLRLIEGTFPPHNNIIPKDGQVTALVDAAALLSAVKTVEPVAKDASNITTYHLNGNIQVSAQRDGMDKPVQVQVAAETSGAELDIKLNCTYVRQMLETIQKHALLFSFTDARKPVKVTCPALPGLTVVLMPMQVNR